MLTLGPSTLRYVHHFLPSPDIPPLPLKIPTNLHLQVRAKLGKGAELEAMLRHVILRIQSEPGTLIFDRARDLEDRDPFPVYEKYAGREALEAHMES